MRSRSRTRARMRSRARMRTRMRSRSRSRARMRARSRMRSRARPRMRPLPGGGLSVAEELTLRPALGQRREPYRGIRALLHGSRGVGAAHIGAHPAWAGRIASDPASVAGERPAEDLGPCIEANLRHAIG